MTSTDLVVVLPGILGSTLGVRTADTPAAATPIWAPTAGALWRGLTGGPKITDYPMPAGIGDQHPDDGVEPVALMPDVHAIPGLWTPVKGYDPLLGFLRRLGYREPDDGRPGNLLPVPYDWRLSNRHNGQRLAGIVEPALDRWRSQGGRYADAQAVFICHSMGGLVARWYIEKCGGAEHTRKLVTLGTPWRGAAAALTQLVNGVRKGIGPFSVNLTTFARSLVSTHQLIPEYAAIETGRDYLKTTETHVPELDTARLADAMAFHLDLQAAEAARPAANTTTHMIVGTRQPTLTTVRLTDETALGLNTIGPDNDYGDATVPLTGAVGLGQDMASNLLTRVADQHGNLHRNQQVLDQIQEILTAQPVRRRADKTVALRVAVPDLVLTTEPLTVSIDIDPLTSTGREDSGRRGLRIKITDESGRTLASRQPMPRDRQAEATFTGLPPGAHTITVEGVSPASPVIPVTATTVNWNPASTPE